MRRLIGFHCRLKFLGRRREVSLNIWYVMGWIYFVYATQIKGRNGCISNHLSVNYQMPE